MVKEKKVSIVIPIYNVKDYLEECLDCVVNQSLKELEIICVNDGSTDGSESIVEAYAKEDDRIIVINKHNTGYGHSVNLGIRMATGEYVGVVEPDDYIDLDMMKELYEIAVEKKVDVIKADYDIVRGEYGKRIYSPQKICKNHDFYNQITNARTNKEIFKASLYTWAGIYRAAFLHENQIWHNETPGASYQDNGFWFQVFVKAESIYFVEKSYYRLRRDNPNSSINNRGKVYCICDEYDFIRKKLYEWREEGFLPIQWVWRFKAYVGTLKRIAAEYKDEFLKRFSDDFIAAFKQNEYLGDGLTEEEYQLWKWLLEKNYTKVFQFLFLDKTILDKLCSSAGIIIYGEEDRARDICKRLEGLKLSRVNVLGVVLTNDNARGVVWNQRVYSMEQISDKIKGSSVLFATKDDIENKKELFVKCGCEDFIDMPGYIKGIKNV